MGLYEDLNYIERRLEKEGYSISHFEVREPTNFEQESSTRELGRRLSQRATGETSLEAVEDWQSIEAEEYVIEVFLSGTMDRVIYEGEEEFKYLKLSGKTDTPEDILEE